MIKQLMVFQFEKADQQTNSTRGWVGFGDFTNAGLSNMNLDWKFAMIEIVLKYYPQGLNKLLFYNVPFILETTIKLLLAFGGQEFSSRLKLISGDELQQHIPNQNLPAYMNDPVNKNDNNILSLILG